MSFLCIQLLRPIVLTDFLPQISAAARQAERSLTAPLKQPARQFYSASSFLKPLPSSSPSQLGKNLYAGAGSPREYNSQPAPESFYQGVLGKVRNMTDMSHENEAGLPSTGREDAVIGVTAARRYAAGDKDIIPSRHVFNEFSLVCCILYTRLTSSLDSMLTFCPLFTCRTSASVSSLVVSLLPNLPGNALPLILILAFVRVNRCWWHWS